MVGTCPFNICWKEGKSHNTVEIFAYKQKNTEVKRVLWDCLKYLCFRLTSNAYITNAKIFTDTLVLNFLRHWIILRRNIIWNILSKIKLDKIFQRLDKIFQSSYIYQFKLNWYMYEDCKITIFIHIPVCEFQKIITCTGQILLDV